MMRESSHESTPPADLMPDLFPGLNDQDLLSNLTDNGIHNVNPGVSDDADNNSINTESKSQLSDTQNQEHQLKPSVSRQQANLIQYQATARFQIIVISIQC